ncbi:MAG TPA: formylmethanofuran dehydrogenase subunit C [Pirellulaceae bacterium]|jgi:formylmethanofuran dehydrogenase subunit C|nr:formylmethanofuran dehydrogenase subunit C [Pirellulaceae bacterium]
MPLTLTVKTPLTLAVEAETLSPATLAGLSVSQIERLPLQRGRRSVRLGEFFSVSGTPDDELRLVGDLSRLHRLGEKMTRGVIFVDGPIGRHAGSQMSGGVLTVRGDAGDWLGAEMRGGKISVSGNAGDRAGGAYVGSVVGMRGGTILVQGSVGVASGQAMRRGLIFVLLDAGETLGYAMRAGTIVVGGNPGERVGAGMIRGTIVALSGLVHAALPTFERSCRFAPPAWPLVRKYLMNAGPFVGNVVPERLTVDLWHGDFLEAGKGEIWAAV